MPGFILIVRKVMKLKLPDDAGVKAGKSCNPTRVNVIEKKLLILIFFNRVRFFLKQKVQLSKHVILFSREKNCSTDLFILNHSQETKSSLCLKETFKPKQKKKIATKNNRKKNLSKKKLT